MEYVYSALLLNATGKKITEENVKKILTSVGISAEESKIKALIAALDGVDVKDAISKSASMNIAAAASTNNEPAKEEEPEEEEVSTEEAAAGLGALFG